MVKRLLRCLMPGFAWDFARRVKALLIRSLQKSLELAGYTVARKKDCYSVLPSVFQLQKTFERWNRPSRLRGLNFDLKRMEEDLSEMLHHYLDEFSSIRPFDQVKKSGFGPGYTAMDALTLYMMIRHAKPKHYIEVGSGMSTYYCSLAAAKNESEGYPLRITCIEPSPYPKLFTIPGVQVISKEVQDVDVSFFEQLQENDVLFIDSSHVLKIDGDVPFLYLEVLPTLKAGVLIHIHDVPFPFNIPYPPQHWILGQNWPKYWNEAMVLQAFLCFNQEFEIVISTPLIRHFDESFLQQRISTYESVEKNTNAFSSIWLRRVLGSQGRDEGVHFTKTL